jgi:hypothetical protein
MKIERLTLRNTPENITTRKVSGSVQPSTYDEEAGTVRFVAATERPTKVFDWEELDLVDEVLLMDGMELPSDRVPLLDGHSRFQVSDVLGSATDFRSSTVDGFKAVEPLVAFSGVSKAKNAAQLVREGHLTDMSVGYRVLETERVPKGETKTIKGSKYEGPVRVTTKWQLKEVSLTPIGADALAKARGNTSTKTEETMKNKLRKFLERMGLPKDATEEQARQFWVEFRKRTDLKQETRSELDTIEKEEGDKPSLAPEEGARSDPQRHAAGQQPQPTGASHQADGQYISMEQAQSMIEEAVRKNTQQLMQLEQQRADEIRQIASDFGLGEEFANELVRKGTSLDEARQQILKKLRETSQPFGAGRFQATAHDQDKFRAAAADGLCSRVGVSPDKPAEGWEDFRGASIEAVARQCLERAGVSTRNMLSREQVAKAVLDHAHRAMSTDDFSSIFLDVQNKSLQRAYRESPRTFAPLVNVTSASDFKTIYGVALSEAPDLDLIGEHGEYKHASFSDRQESYAVKKYGKIAYLTREMIINDDLRAFARIPMLFGAAAARKESDIVWALITSNPTMSDGNALFSAAHSNLEDTTANKGHVNSDNLAAGRADMRKQTGPAGAILNLMPRFVMVPVTQETDTEILVRSATLPSDNKPAGVYNWSQSLTPIAEPRLDNSSTDAWYLAASPSQVDIIEMAFLNGRQQPYTEEETVFARDAVGYKVRHEFGAGVMDWRGLWKNPGA